jgi:Flp pilus assembly pilin Flp
MTKIKLLKAVMQIDFRKDDGQALVEYALVLGLIAIATIVLLTALGQDINALLARVDSAMQSALPG